MAHVNRNPSKHETPKQCWADTDKIRLSRFVVEKNHPMDRQAHHVSIPRTVGKRKNVLNIRKKLN